MSETPHPEIEKDYLEPYYISLGKLVVAWNRLHDVMCRLFQVIEDPTGLASIVPLAVWNAVTSDRTQREMLRAATLARFASDSEFRDRLPAQAADDLEWLIKQTQTV